MAMTISMDDDLKQQFSAMCKELGMSPSTAITVFAKAVVREKRIPFEVSAESARERAQREYEMQVNEGLWESYRQFQEGDYCTREEYNVQRKQVREIA